jgi:hypothetical protein
VRTEVTRLTNRAKREFIAKVPLASRAVERKRMARLDAYRTQLPSLDAADRHLLAELDREGVVVTTLDQLAVPGTAKMKQIVGELLDPLAARDPGPESLLSPARSDLLSKVDLWRWGLDERLLDLAENHLGLPLTYYGGFVARQVADGKVHGARMWHRDIEDHSVLKIIVCLNEVTRSGGPFEYVPKLRTKEIARNLKYVSGYVNDQVMSNAISRQAWIPAVGPKWTAVIADTAQIFHRATAPTGTDRYSVTYTWTAQRPLKTMPTEPFTPDQIRRIKDGLNERQLACLPANFHTR